LSNSGHFRHAWVACADSWYITGTDIGISSDNFFCFTLATTSPVTRVTPHHYIVLLHPTASMNFASRFQIFQDRLCRYSCGVSSIVSMPQSWRQTAGWSAYNERKYFHNQQSPAHRQWVPHPLDTAITTTMTAEPPAKLMLIEVTDNFHCAIEVHQEL